MSKLAWVTLSTNDTYALGALVLAYSLKNVNTIYPMAIMVTPNVSVTMRDCLKILYELVEEVNIIDSQDAINLALLKRPELGITFTKFYCWRLTQYEKCVFLDADTLVLQNCDELFEREELSAAPDVSWPDCFNSGVFVYQPNLHTFNNIIKFAVEHGSFDGGDQGILNQYFNNWSNANGCSNYRLSFLYNVTAYAMYCYLPAFKQFRDQIKILHFAGQQKPWQMLYNLETKMINIPSEYEHARDFIQLWWNLFLNHVHPHFNNNMLNMMMHASVSNITQNQQQHDYSQSNVLSNYTNYCYKKHKQKNYIINDNNGKNSDDNGDGRICSQDNENTINRQLNIQFKSMDQQQQQHYTHYIKYNYGVKEMAKKEEEKQKEKEGENYFEAINILNRNATFSSISNNELLYSNCCYVVQNFTQQQQEEKEDKEQQQNEIFKTNLLINHLWQIETEFNTNGNNIKHKNEITTATRQTTIENYVSNIKTTLIDNEESNKEDKIKQQEKQHVENYGDNANNESKNSQIEVGLAGQFAKLHVDDPINVEQSKEYDLSMRRKCWESGHVDYTGVDSFDNIWKHIEETLQQTKSHNTTSGT